MIAAKRLGGEQIIILGRHPDRISLAREFGATDVVSERGPEAVERVKELTGGHGVHSVLGCVGLDQSVETAIEIARPGGAVDQILPRRWRRRRHRARHLGKVEFAVSDQGIGIPAPKQHLIFEKFYRAEPDMDHGISGTGLGLYICRELIQRMHGTISVTSEPGRGSTFTIRLPRVDRA